MERYRGYESLDRRLREPVVAIGNFDGVHVGHQQLLALAVERARARGGEAVVLTFDPHPARVLAPSLAPALLTPLPRKLELLDAAGIDVTVVQPFTPEFARRSAAEFVADALLGGLGARELVVGYDFTYGQKRQGTVETLRRDGDAHGVSVHVVPAVTVDGLVASSTKIREFVLEGRVEGARLLLGREFDVDGTVVRGAGRGRAIGIPTANVAVDGEILPRPGVYAVHVTLFGDAPTVHAGVANLGKNPTFMSGGALSLEAHILDFEGDLYGRRLRVGFHARLRDEERFPSVDALVAQIRRDIDAARRIFDA